MARVFFKETHRRRRRRRVWAVALVVVGWGVGTQAAHAQAPDEAWRTVSTEHFRVTFPQDMEALGRRAATRAETAYGLLAEAFVDPPGGRIDILLTDHTDASNGFAQVTPSNRITIFARPPVDDLGLGYFDEWMELVITHELAHIFHLDQTGTVGRILRGLFGRAPGPWPFFPNFGVPRWTIEGLATWYESSFTDAGRVHGSWHEMVLRTAALEGRFEDLDQASGDSPTWPAGSRSYIYGSLFFEHLLDKHGEEKMGAFADAVAGQWVPYRLDAAGRDAFGASISEEWRAWTEEVEAEARAEVARMEAAGPLTSTERLTDGGRFALYPKVSPDGSRVAYASADGRSDTQIRLIDPDGGEARELTRTNGISEFEWLPDGDLLLSQFELRGPYRSYADLYRADRQGRTTRVTRGARLTQPSVSPDGTWVVAVQEGGGTNGLARIDLASGTVSTWVAAEPDVHWARPAVSPDGRWVAVSRWTPGAETDLVLLDASGREVTRITRDRALDLGAAWSPDGRALVWMSDRTGVPNIHGVDVDPTQGRVGDVRMVTRLATGAANPSVDPRGRWLYFSAYHASGWEIERIPFDPSSWTELLPPAPRFTGPGRAPPPDAYAPGPVQGYSPFPTLLPRYWEPLYREPVRTGTVRTQDLFIPGRELLGRSFGASVEGRDLVGRHSYDAFARIFSGGDRADVGASYNFSGLGNPVLSLGVSQFWDDDGVRLARLEETDPFDTLFVLERERAVGATVTFLVPSWRRSLSLSLGGTFAWERRDLLDNNLAPSTTYRLTRPESRLADGRVTLAFSTVRGYSFGMGGANGVSALVRIRRRVELEVPDSLSGVPGSDRSLNDVIGRLSVYKALGGPGHAPHVLALRGAFGVARGAGAGIDHFEIGGAAGRSETVTGLTLFGGSPLFFPVRGYLEASRFGRNAWAASAEYRFPLWMVNQGLGAWPLHVDRVGGSVFWDAGNAWGPDVSTRGFDNTRRATLYSVGAEVTAEILTFWSYPLRVRTGVGIPLLEGAGARVYARLGLAF